MTALHELINDMEKAYELLFKAHGVAVSERDALAVRVAELEAAIHGVLAWDEKRNFPIPYKVRDPLRAALTTPESNP